MLFTPEQPLSISAACPAGEGRMLLLLRDHGDDPLELRARVVIEFDLRTGQSRKLLRTPGDWFINSIDWIATPEASAGR